MKAITNTISSIDESSKKILFKHFDQKNVNKISNESINISDNLTKIASDAQNTQIQGDIDSSNMTSDDSGN